MRQLTKTTLQTNAATDERAHVGRIDRSGKSTNPSTHPFTGEKHVHSTAFGLTVVTHTRHHEAPEPLCPPIQVTDIYPPSLSGALPLPAIGP